ncbi:hypothetical protein M3Y97_00029500 [Aphelenchoides bicaudatus]|nr:hypothetical protein M3Y97_00029500 [Aphelenchoides bicaudatus]
MPSDKDLDAVGLPSTSTVQDLLDNAEDPRQAISEFQEQNALLLPSLKPILKLLELHGILRHEYHELVLGKLSEQLLEKIRALGNSKNPEDVKKLDTQLERCFKLYHVPKIRPIVLETLGYLPKVPSKTLKRIVEDHDLYLECSTSVKQQIWLTKDELFEKAVDPVLDLYVDGKEEILTTVTRGSSFFTCSTTKSRRQQKQIKELLTMIGAHEKLYQKLQRVLRERFVETAGCFHYCSLRLELLMAIHDVNLDYATKIDQAHDLAWCLDACIRDHHIDVHQVAKLKALLDRKKLTDQNVGDASFVLADSHTVHFLCSTVVKIIYDYARKCVGLPRENAALLILLRLLYLGTSALNFASGEILEHNASITSCLTRFLPLVSQYMARNFLRAELARAPSDVIEELSLTFDVQAPPDTLVQFVKSDIVCALIWFHYTLDLLSPKNRSNPKEVFESCLRVSCKSKDKILFKEPWTSILTNHLIQSPLVEQNINDDKFSKVVIHDYLIRGANQNANSRFHLIHLLSAVMPHVTSEELPEKVLNALNQHATTSSFVGQTSASRFEKEFQDFSAKIQGKAAEMEQTTTESHPIEIPTIPAPVDFLSTMDFDD